MCGRYQLNVSASALQAARPNTTWRPHHQEQHAQRQQVRPTNTAPVLVAVGPIATPTRFHDNVSTELVIMKWGFANPARDVHQPLINARSETLLNLPTFRRLLHHPAGSRRCAVPATAFFEWHRSAPPGKQTLTPYLVRHPETEHASSNAESFDGNDGQSKTSPPNISYLAALYDDCSDAQSAAHSFVIITTASSSDFSWLHSRQPVFLSSEDQMRSWLQVDTVPPNEAVAALQTQTGLVCTKMLRDLSAPAPNQKEFRQKGISSFFGKASAGKSTPSKTKSKSTESGSTLATLKTNVSQKQTQTGSNDKFDIPSAPHSPSPKSHDALDEVDEITVGHALEPSRSKESKNNARSDSRSTHASPLKPAPVIQKTKSSPPQSKQKKSGQTSIHNFFHSNK